MGKKILCFFLLFISVVGLVGGICYLFYYHQPVIASMQIIVAAVYGKEVLPRMWRELNS